MIESIILNKQVNRIWILGDMHLGVRSNSLEWLNIQKDFYENQFIPHLKKHYKDGDILVQVGDAFDNRQSINLRVLHYAVDLFERLGEILPVHIIAGNHDIWAKSSNEVSSIDSLKWIPNIQVHKEPIEYKWGNKKVLLMPWRRDVEHEIETLSEYTQSNILFCHSEVRGISLNAKVKNIHGMDVSSYKKYDRVYSGHIHYRQLKDNVHMVGTPYELTRSDSGNTKGFDIVDLSTMENTFIENIVSPKFLRYYLTDLYYINLGEFKSRIKNNFVDLYVPSSTAITTRLGKLINKIQGISRKIEPNIYDEDSFIDKDLYDMDDIDDMYKNYNILHLCNMYADGMSYDKEVINDIKEKLKNLHDICINKYKDNE